MTCETCTPWASRSWQQHQDRQKKIKNNPTVTVAVCPMCKTTDWADNTQFITDVKRGGAMPSLMVWAGIIIAVSFILVFTVVRQAKAELCLEKIDNTITVRNGFKWNWRTIDGRKCWYLANSILPREDLIWSYQSDEFDEDVIVRERKWYYPQTDENGLLILKSVEEVRP